jgi:hypothetical protein
MGPGQRGRSGLWILALLGALGGGGYAGIRKFGIPPVVAHWLGKDEGAAASPPPLASEAKDPEAPPKVAGVSPGSSAPAAKASAAKKAGLAASESAGAKAQDKGDKQGDKTSNEKGRATAAVEKAVEKAAVEKAVVEKAAAAEKEPPEKEVKARGARPHSAVEEARARVKRLTQSPDYVPPPSGGEAPVVPSPP